MGTNVGGTERRARVVAVVVAFLLMVGLSLSAMPAPLAAASEASGTWGSVELPSPTRLVELEPSEVDSTGIPADASFRLVSHATEPAASLAERLVVEPHIDLSVQPGADASVVGAPACSSRLSRDRSSTSASTTWTARAWAPGPSTCAHRSMSSRPLPRHHARKVPPNSGIELTFDRDGVIEPERSFSIEPPVQGRFQRRGRVLSFVPEQAPAAGHRLPRDAGRRCGHGRSDDPHARRHHHRIRDQAGQGGQARPCPATRDLHPAHRRGAAGRARGRGGVRATRPRPQRVSVDLYRFELGSRRWSRRCRVCEASTSGPIASMPSTPRAWSSSTPSGRRSAHSTAGTGNDAH